VSHSIRQATLDDLDALVPLFDAYRHFYGKPSDPQLGRAFLEERLILRESVIFGSPGSRRSRRIHTALSQLLVNASRANLDPQ
jgi:hypothetical protein